jgi:hypothetical protein
MTTTVTLRDREAEELETGNGPPMKWSLQSVRLACRTVDVFLNKTSIAMTAAAYGCRSAAAFG